MASFTFDPLTPVAFLRRSAAAFPEREAIVDGPRRWTYREFAERCDGLSRALAALGIGHQDKVAAICSNSHVMLELHHGVPARGAVLVPINTRLTRQEMAYIVRHSDAGLIVATCEYADMARAVASEAGARVLVAGDDKDEYEVLLERAAATDAACPGEIDERQLLAINYTSGTTGHPKGVMYHHRGAFLQAVAMCHHAGLGPDARYLWTLPMFHCDGWCFTWAVTAAGGTHVCLRRVDADEIWARLRADGITHMSAAPTVLTMIAEAPAAAELPGGRTVHVDTGGAPPSPALLARLDRLGLRVTHLYGLTETFGPIAVNEWQNRWDDLTDDEQSRLRARQGISNIVATPLRVVDDDGRDVPADGATVGELTVRGNDVMLGYYRDEAATDAVTVDGGWLLTGDLAVKHPDGYVEVRDRRKDVIISGGENIASVEVEKVLDSHPDVLESAVVAAPDPRWGEVPLAYVCLRSGATFDPAALTAHIRAGLAGFKVPKAFVVAELPKTSTGKVQKNVLRAWAVEHWGGHTK